MEMIMRISEFATAAIDAKLARVRDHLKSMQALEGQLVTLRSRCGVSHAAGHCGILLELVAAVRGEACACHVPISPESMSTGMSARLTASRSST